MQVEQAWIDRRPSVANRRYPARIDVLSSNL